MEEIKRQEILKALESGDYKIEMEEPNNVILCTKYDGTKFLKLEDMDGIKSSNDNGQCVLTVCGYTVGCDLTNGDYYGDKELLDDEEIMEAIEMLDDMCTGEVSDPDAQVALYNEMNGTNFTTYYIGDEAPKDVDDEDCLIWVDVDFTVKTGEEEESVTGDGAQLYEVYKYMRDNNLLSDETVYLTPEQVEAIDGGLYESICDDVTDEWQLVIAPDIFEKNLGEEEW